MFEKIGNAWVRKLKACVTAQKHSAKTSFNTSFDSMALSTDADGTTETDNTW